MKAAAKNYQFGSVLDDHPTSTTASTTTTSTTVPPPPSGRNGTFESGVQGGPRTRGRSSTACSPGHTGQWAGRMTCTSSGDVRSTTHPIGGVDPSRAYRVRPGWSRRAAARFASCSRSATTVSVVNTKKASITASGSWQSVSVTMSRPAGTNSASVSSGPRSPISVVRPQFGNPSTRGLGGAREADRR